MLATQLARVLLLLLVWILLALHLKEEILLDGLDVGEFLRHLADEFIVNLLVLRDGLRACLCTT